MLPRWARCQRGLLQYYWTEILDTQIEIEQEINASWNEKLEYVVCESVMILKL